jgi:anhydro-N-acetylmuramic acid kinase
MAELFAGLMSGTSLDGVDGVLLDVSGPNLDVLAHVSVPMSAALSGEMLALNSAGPNELHRAALAASALVRIYAQVISELLDKTGLDKSAVTAIGAHGQTVRHQPRVFDGIGYTLQLNNPALLAELTGIDVVADFRSRDVAAGGQGAPLVPAFHQSVFGLLGETVSALNIGGISNLTVIGPELADDVLGFDCGPGNVLMNAWCQHHLGVPFDAEGSWAAAGSVHAALLEALLEEPYFRQLAPKSTGRDLFNINWLTRQLEGFRSVAPVDVQATLTELTAVACANDVRHYAAGSKSLIVCGGGAFNTHLVSRLQAHLPLMLVQSSDVSGLPPQQVEAAAFAWLAHKTIRRETASLKSVTGAQGARILGAVYSA